MNVDEKYVTCGKMRDSVRHCDVSAYPPGPKCNSMLQSYRKPTRASPSLAHVGLTILAGLRRSVSVGGSAAAVATTKTLSTVDDMACTAGGDAINGRPLTEGRGSSSPGNAFTSTDACTTVAARLAVTTCGRGEASVVGEEASELLACDACGD